MFFDWNAKYNGNLIYFFFFRDTQEKSQEKLYFFIFGNIKQYIHFLNWINLYLRASNFYNLISNFPSWSQLLSLIHIYFLQNNHLECVFLAWTITKWPGLTTHMPRQQKTFSYFQMRNKRRRRKKLESWLEVPSYFLHLLIVGSLSSEGETKGTLLRKKRNYTKRRNGRKEKVF